MSGFFQDAVARPQHQHADGRADGGVHPVCAGRADDQRPGKYADVGESVAKIVNQDAAQVEVAAAAQQSKRDAAIHGQRSERNPDHQVIAHCLRVAQASVGLVKQEQRHQLQQDGVGERRQNTRAVVAVGLLGIRRALGPAQRKPGNHQRGHIGEVMNGVAHQGDRVAQVTAHQFGDH